MNNNDGYVFRRIRGRIVKIKKKDGVGAAQIAAGAGLSGFAGAYAAKKIKMANHAFANSAHIRGASKLVFSKKGSKYSQLIHSAAVQKVVGKTLSKKGFAALTIGTTLGTGFALSGLNKIMKGRVKTDEKKTATAAALTAGITAVGLTVFAKKTRLGALVNLAKTMNPKKPVSELFNLYSKQGMKKTANTVNKYAKAQYKGFVPKPPTVYNAKQQDLFSTKKFDIKKWLK